MRPQNGDRGAPPAAAQIPVDGAHDERQDDGEHKAHGVVVWASPISDQVLLQQQRQLAPLALRVGALEVQVLAAGRGDCQLGDQLLVLPAAAETQTSTTMPPQSVTRLHSSIRKKARNRPR